MRKFSGSVGIRIEGEGMENREREFECQGVSAKGKTKSHVEKTRGFSGDGNVCLFICDETLWQRQEVRWVCVVVRIGSYLTSEIYP